MKNPFLKKQTEEKTPEIPKVQVSAYLNPMWEIEVNHNGRQLIKMPFCFLIHTHLKDYGFDPDARTQKPPVVTLRLGKGSEAKLPLFVNSLPKGWR